jgi:hypothetical protein
MILRSELTGFGASDRLMSTIHANWARAKMGGIHIYYISHPKGEVVG